MGWMLCTATARDPDNIYQWWDGVRAAKRGSEISWLLLRQPW